METQPRDQMLAAAVWKSLKTQVGTVDRSELLVLLRELRDQDESAGLQRRTR